jgi:membrane-associated protease RseP (regulator of RpoE activity)
MFATALNLLPVGQLDGGHIVFSVSPRWHRVISLLAILALVPLGKYLWMGWLIWAILLIFTLRHPNVPRYPDVSGPRRVLAIVAVLMLVLTFTPAPLKGSSGRDAWRQMSPQVWEASRDTLGHLRDGALHWMHRK